MPRWRRKRMARERKSNYPKLVEAVRLYHLGKLTAAQAAVRGCVSTGEFMHRLPEFDHIGV